MVGCTGLYLDVLGCGGLCSVLGCGCLYWAVLIVIGLYWAVLGCVGLSWAVLGGTKLYWEVLECTRRYWTVLGETRLYRIGLMSLLIHVCLHIGVKTFLAYGSSSVNESFFRNPAVMCTFRNCH